MEINKSLRCTRCESVFNRGLKQDYCPSCNYYSLEKNMKQTQLINRRITGNCVAFHGRDGALDIVFDQIRKMYHEQINMLETEGENAEFQIVFNRLDL